MKVQMEGHAERGLEGQQEKGRSLRVPHPSVSHELNRAENKDDEQNNTNRISDDHEAHCNAPLGSPSAAVHPGDKQPCPDPEG